MNLLKAGLFALTVLTPLKALGHEAPIRVVVLGEDSDRNAVSRSSEIYTEWLQSFSSLSFAKTSP